MFGDWRDQIPYRLNSSGRLELTSREAGRDLLLALGGRLHDDEDSDDLVESLTAEAVIGAFFLRKVELPFELGWLSPERLLGTWQMLRKGLHAGGRMDKALVLPDALVMESTSLASCRLVVTRGLRLAGPLLQDENPNARAIEIGREGVILLGYAGTKMIVEELQSGKVVVRWAVGSRSLYVLAAWEKVGSALFPSEKAQRRVIARIAAAKARLARRG